MWLYPPPPDLIRYDDTPLPPSPTHPPKPHTTPHHTTPHHTTPHHTTYLPTYLPTHPSTHPTQVYSGGVVEWVSQGASAALAQASVCPLDFKIITAATCLVAATLVCFGRFPDTSDRELAPIASFPRRLDTLAEAGQRLPRPEEQSADANVGK